MNNGTFCGEARRGFCTWRRLAALASALSVYLTAGYSAVDHLVTFAPAERSFALANQGAATPIIVDAHDYPGVQRVAGDFQADVNRVTGLTPALLPALPDRAAGAVVVGTLGHSALIDQWAAEGKIDVAAIRGQWESFVIAVVEHPSAALDRALVVAGSDKRGAIYGVYELSQQMGVSPWYWWADVPTTHRDAVFVAGGAHVQGPPSVKYRGIFLNDEAPDLTNWIEAKFGTVPPSKNPPIPPGIANYNHEFYTKLFEVLLRLKGNYLWPAMWNNAFNEDDPENPRLADLYGVVMGTSHQEPMLRAQKEWDRRYLHSIGTWNYAKHPDVLENFWREGVRRNKPYESIITMGLRGANDTPMAPGGPEANMALLQKIVARQRQILGEEVNPDLTKIPQLWCLYKEVQDFYEAGMTVPEDVTLLWAEDNWGNVRRLPTAEERKRPGGAGVYYHFDYHGGPRSYQWVNTAQIAKIWDQMSLAKDYGADRIWIVNVGHFKGYELPMEYFLALGWDTQKWTNANLNEFTREWAERQFGPAHAAEIADILEKYTKYNARRKPELLAPNTYSLVNYREAERVVADYDAIAARAQQIYDTLPSEKRDAFYQLVLFPTKACAVVNELYYAAGRNELYAQQGRASANDMATLTHTLFKTDTDLMDYYNHEFAGGKWAHFMDQAHLGYLNWRDPPKNSLQAISFRQTEPKKPAAMGVAIAGSERAWPGVATPARLPTFDVFNRQRQYVEVFNRGQTPFDFTITASAPWMVVSDNRGTVDQDRRVWVSVDWTKVPSGKTLGELTVTGAGQTVHVALEAFRPDGLTPDQVDGFVEGEGYVAIEAEHFARNLEQGPRRWLKIEDYGATLSGLRATAPPDLPSVTDFRESPCLEYRIYLFDTGKVDVAARLAPTLNFAPEHGLRYAVSFDDEAPQVVTLVPKGYRPQSKSGIRDWEESVTNNLRVGHSTHTVTTPGYHTLKIWMIDPGVLVEKLVLDLGGVKPSYLGPPESFHRASPKP